MTTFTKDQIMAVLTNFHEVMEIRDLRVQSITTALEKEVAEEGDLFSIWGQHYRIAGSVKGGKIYYQFEEI
jgi:hypothetical protein